MPPLPKLTAADLDAIAFSAITPTFGTGPSNPRTKIKEPAPPRRSRRTAADRAAERRPVVSRSMRRYINDMGLLASAAESGALPSTRAELRALFERNATSSWTLLAEDPDAAAIWRRFVDMDDEQQQHILMSSQTQSVACSHGKSVDDAQADVDTALNRVDRRLRRLFKSRSTVVKPLVKELEERFVALPPGQSVVLKLPHSLYRMVAHGVAQFHAMGHRSLGEGDKRVTVIHASPNCTVATGPRLLDVLG